MGRRILLAILGLFTAGAVAQAQAVGRIVGRVTSAEGRSLPGIQITVNGTTRGAVSDTAGRFTIGNVPVGTHTVLARGIGYASGTASVTVTADQPATATFSLETAPLQLDPIVSVGYGTSDRRAVTGAVGSVQAAQLKDVPTNDPMKALQGKLPGVDISSTSNEPGAAMSVRIRGVRSLRAGNDPLYVVDGIPISGGIQDFNPQIIESIDVLKDAAATAIYGSRGANGVILVTTKKGPRDGGLHAQYSTDMYYGNQSPIRLIPMMNLDQYVRYMKDAVIVNDFVNNRAPGTDTTIAAIFTTAKQQYAVNNNITTDWQKATLRSGLQKSIQGGLLGSNADTRYSVTGNYYDQVGVLPGQGYTRGNAFASIDHTSRRLNIGLSANGSRITTDQGEGAAAYGYVLAMSPLGQPTNYMNADSAGLYDPRPDDDPLNINPLLEAQSVTRQQLVNRVFGSAYAEYQLADGLSYRMNFGPDYTAVTTGCFNNMWTHGNCNNASGGLGANSTNQGQPAQAGLSTNNIFGYTLDNLAHFNRAYGSQRFDLTGLYSIQYNRTTTSSIYATNLPYTTQLWYDLGSGTQSPEASGISEWSLESWMGRLNYTLLDRYSFSFTGRSDGSSRLAPGHKWTFFPSAGVAWQLGDESFMRGLDFLRSLKVRASYGTTGNTAINPYQTQGTLGAKIYTFGGTRVRGYRPANIPNPDLSWEKTDQSDIGIDYSIFNDRFSGGVDVYKYRTHDLLLPENLPATSGFSSTVRNVGSTENTGVELSLSSLNIRNWRGLTWSTDWAWSHNANKITALADGVTQDLSNVWFVGKPINGGGQSVYFDYKYIGVWQIADSVAMKAMNTAGGSTFRAGDPKVADISGPNGVPDGKITADDRMIVGTSYPAWTGSMTNRLTFKGWDISALVTAKWKYTFIDGTPRSYFSRYGNVDDMDYWTPTNPTNHQPAPTTGAATRPYSATRLYTDGSHWRIRNITAGYTFDSRLVQRLGLRSARFYGTLQDPYIHTDYIGIDPDIGGALPTLKTLLIGSNIVW